jgi:branched-chain amino acid aminotransferase
MAWINGKVCKAEDAKISVFDRGFLFGDAVYETGLSEGRVFLFLEEHLTRLRRSASRLSIPISWTDAQIVEGLYEVGKAFDRPNIYFRIIVSRGIADVIGLDISNEPSPSLVHLVQALDREKIERQSQKGIYLQTSTVIRNSAKALDPNIKTSNYLNSLLALQEVKSRGADDAMMTDARGIVTEGTTFSVFGVRKDGALITPSLEVGILDSITRKTVLEIARTAGIKSEQGEYRRDDFLNCSEVFIASSVRGCASVARWDDRHFFPIPGEMTRRLQQGLTQARKSYAVGKRSY